MRPPVRPVLLLPAPRRSAWGFWVALALHALMLVFLVSDVGRNAWVRTLAPGPVAVAPHGGGGGSGGREHSVAYISLPAAPAPSPVVLPKRSPVVPRAEPVPPVLPPVAERAADTTPPAPPAPAESAGAQSAGPGEGDGRGAGAGGGEGGGTGGGVGAGTGPGLGGGEGGRGTAPEPRQLVLPPSDYPKDLRGRRVDVTFFVAADGRVERIAVTPEIRDGGFARKFDEAMRNYRFRPARSPEGTPVPGTTTVTVFF